MQEDLVRTAEEKIQQRTPKEIAALLNALNVHRAELEMQNEELRTSHQLLEQTRDRLADLYDFSPMGYVTLDTRGIMQELNLTAAAMLEHDRGFLQRMPLGDFIVPEDRRHLSGHLAECRNAAEEVTTELRLRSVKGRVRLVEIRSIAINDLEYGQQYRTVITDITKRKRGKEAWQDQPELLAAILDNIPVLLCIWDARLHRFRFNKHFRDVLGWTEADADGGDFMAKVYPDPDCRQQVSEYMLSLEQGWRDLKTTAKDGTAIDISWANVRLADGTSIGIGLDIRPRKAMEEGLRKSEGQLRAFVRSGLFGVFWADDQGQLQDCDDEFARIIGRGRGEVQAGCITLNSLTPPEDRPLDEAALAEARATGFCKPYEKRLLRPDGTSVPVLGGLVLPELDRQQWVGFVVDITDRKRAELALRESEGRLRLAAKATNDVIWDWDIVHDLQQWNEAGATVFGWPEIVERPQTAAWWVERVHPEDRARVEEGFRAVFEGRDCDHWQDEYRFLKSDGTYASVLDRGYVLRDEHGNAVRMIGAMLDLTERKQAEKALRESEQLYRAIGESIDYGVWVCDPEGRNTYASDSFLKLVGITSQQCSQFGWGSVLHPDDAERTIAAWKECVRSGGTWDIEHRFRGADGQWHPVLARGVPVRDEQGRIKCWAGINLDISRMKQVEEELKSLTHTLEKRVAERTAEAHWRANQLQRLAAQMAQVEERERRRLSQLLHDGLQQTLVAAKLRLKAASRNLQDEWANTALSEGISLVDEAITESRTLTKELSPPVLYDGGLAAGLQWLGRETERKYQLPVSVEVAAEMEPDDLTTRVFVFQAARELILNAVKHAQPSSLKIGLSRTDDDRLQVTVADDGIGFNTEIVNAKNHAAGFGLFSIGERLRVIGGELAIASSSTEGTQARIIAPCMQAPREELSPGTIRGEASRLPDAAPARTSRIRILLADDHPLLRKGLADALTEYPDLDVIGEAENGQEALEMALELRPEVILMDITMPRMDGIEATRQIKQAAPGIAVIGLSMHETEDMMSAMKYAGASEYLTKNAPTEDMIAAILRVCPRTAGHCG